MVAIKRVIEPYERKKAKERQLDTNPSGKKLEQDPSGNLPQRGKSRDIVADFLGLGERTLKKAEDIVNAAEQNPEKYQLLLDKVDSKKLSVDKAAKIIKKDKRRQEIINNNNSAFELPQSCDLRLGDFRELSTDIADNSISLIPTDPPYEDTEENLLLYEELAKLATRVLKPGGVLIFLVGGVIIDKVVVKLDKFKNSGLNFWWLHAMEHTGSSRAVYPYGIDVKQKSWLGYIKGENKKPDCLIGLIPDLIKSSPPDKSLHEGAQSPVEAEHFIKYLSVENEIILDSFMGSGTTGIAALNLGRRFIGIEKDPENFEIAKNRLKQKHKLNQQQKDTSDLKVLEFENEKVI